MNVRFLEELEVPYGFSFMMTSSSGIEMLSIRPLSPFRECRFWTRRLTGENTSHPYI